MRVTVKIQCDNDAFSSNPAYEVARILGELSEHLNATGRLQVGDERTLFDGNGNTVGRFKVRDDKGD